MVFCVRNDYHMVCNCGFGLVYNNFSIVYRAEIVIKHALPGIKLERLSYDLEKWFRYVFVTCFISRWMKRSKHGLFVFPAKEVPNMAKALFNWPIVLQ